MARQALLWTALPNGYSDDGQSLRVSVLVSPRLDPQSDPAELSTFPDFVDWPGILAQAKFDVRYGGASVTIAGNDTVSPNRIDTTLGGPDTSVWTALFTEETPVQGFIFKNLAGNKVLSYPAANIDALVQKLYVPLGTAANDDLPKVTEILNEPNWKKFVDAVAYIDRVFLGEKNKLRDVQEQFSVFADGGFDSLEGVRRDLALFQLFHTPPSTPKLEKYAVPAGDPKSYAKWLGFTQTALPKPADFQKEIDFHRIVAAMNQFPTLLRRLGLVVDLLIAKGQLTPSPNALLQVTVSLPPGTPSVSRAQDASLRMRTLLDKERFQPVPRPGPQPGDYGTADRLLVLDPKLFQLVQLDGDGAGLKVMNFARTLARIGQAKQNQLDAVTQHEREAGAPALRNAGLMLVHMQRAAMLENSFDRQEKLNNAVELIHNGANPAIAPKLFAEDVVRGWRIDIWDGKTKVWRSLCQRTAHYDIGGGSALIDVPAGPDEKPEEGTLRLGATKTPDPASNPNLVWLHEALLSWTGWSLCAQAPGKTIHHKRDDQTPPDPKKDHVDEPGDAEAEVPPGIRVKTTFTAFKHSLPRLRYGRSYWIRARAVDLAGNSLPVQENDFGPEKPALNATAYLRYEPIPPPALALVKPKPDKTETPAEGESMDRIAVRSFNDTPAQNTDPSKQRARRFAVPSRTSAREAELHGMLDVGGKVDPAFFATLAAKDESLDEEKIKLAGPLNPDAAVETTFAVMEEGMQIPYLPEPLAVTIAARIFGHPTFSSSELISIPLYPGSASWPNAAPFKIEVYEKAGDQPHFVEAGRTLFIPLPKAIKATLRLSVKPTREALRILGVWQWLTPASSSLRRRVANGQHWMLTPWRDIEIVHAVQRPLITPGIKKTFINRGLKDTFALPTFVASCSIKSTDHLDLRAQWSEPTEDVTKPEAGANRGRTDHAFAIKITDEQSYAGTPDYLLESPDVIRAGGNFHDRVATKLHEFNDTRYRRIEYWLEATTKFREFMPSALLTKDANGVAEPTDANIKVVGPKVRTWIPNSAPPPAPEVLYVVPTFGWVRTKNGSKQFSWRRGGGLRVYLNRPWNVSGYGEMLAVVVPSAAFKGDPAVKPKKKPLKNFVTQWGNDPVWLSPYVAGPSPKPANFPLARTAPDPTGKWLPNFAPVDPADPTAPSPEADQPAGPFKFCEPFKTTGLAHPESISVAPQHLVDVAPHDVFFDDSEDERRLWYCDIEVNWGSSYYPFIRLALARYQPVSVTDAYLSNIVLADFMPLVSDRWLSVTQAKDPKTRSVSVFGSTYTDSSSHLEAEAAVDVAPSSIIEIWVERLDPTLGEDFGWTREIEAVITPAGKPKKKPTKKTSTSLKRAKQLLRRRDYSRLLSEKLIDRVFISPPLWSGTVTLPEAPEGAVRYRLVISEFEEYLVDDADPYEPPVTKKDRRLVFVEHVELSSL